MNAMKRLPSRRCHGARFSWVLKEFLWMNVICIYFGGLARVAAQPKVTVQPRNVAVQF
jgi:hypothetical protein